MNKKQSRRKSPTNKKQSRRKSPKNKKQSVRKSSKNKKQSVRIHRRIKNDGGSPFRVTETDKKYNLNYINNPSDVEYNNPSNKSEDILVPKGVKVVLIKKYSDLDPDIWIGKVTKDDAFKKRFPNYPDDESWPFIEFILQSGNDHVYITNFDIKDI
jgi:hypothetical protein